MANEKVKIMDLTPGTPVDSDYIPFIDVSDTTQSPEGTTKRGLKSALKGDDGNGIDNIALINTVGLVKTYRITYTDTTTFDYDVIDGEDGTASYTDAEIKTKYENNTDTNAFTDTEKTNVSTIPVMTTNISDNTISISANTQAIANLAIAQGSFENQGNPIFVLTTSEQNLPFSVVNSSSDTDIFEFDDINNEIDLKVNAPYNFSTDMTFLHNTTLGRTITIRGRKVSDDSLVYSRQVTVEAGNGDYSHINTSTLLPIGQPGYPSVPFSMYFTIEASDTGITLYNFSSILATGSMYDVALAEVTLNGVETLTNKTIDYNNNTILNLPSGGGGVSEVFQASLSGSYNLTTTTTTLPFNTESIDTGANFNTTTYEYTAPSDGNYIFQLKSNTNSATAGDLIVTYILLNGLNKSTAESNGDRATFTNNVLLTLTAGDVVKVQSKNFTGARGILSGGTASTTFSGYKLN